MDSGEIKKPTVNSRAARTSHGRLPGIAASSALGLLLICNTASAATPAQISEQRERAVATARNGQLEQAIAELQRLDSTASDTRTTHDLIVILTWAGRQQEALDVYEQRGVAANAPDYVQAAVARAYRSRGAYGQAERIARAALEKTAGEPAWTTFLALVMTDQGRAAEADTLLQSLTEKNPGNVDAWLARGYAAKTLGQPFAAMRAYAEVRRLQPENAEATRELQRILLELRAPYAAGSLAASPGPEIRGRQAA